ncbi:MAG: OmpA family protein [Eubacteriales bacterium]|nr:OmpA family protein [Eubacteriales bacterium]
MRKKKSENSGFNVWRSYSDMMAGVLLLFVLIMCVTLFQAQKSYDASIKERDEKIALQEEYTLEILAKQNALEEKEGQLKNQDEQLKTQDEKLAEQQQLLAELAAKLKDQESTLNAQKTALDEKTALLADQQAKIDNIIGVKAEVVESLKQEFAKNNVTVDIDSQTGALTLDANVMFDYDEADLTKEGEQALKNILPIYCKVLLEEAHKPYLAEIIIDGYTDTDGDYSYNLELSQQRSLAVAQYLLDIQYDFLNDSQVADLEDYLTVNGHSMANPILDENGNVDKDASRRVEVKFRLKDDEMIDELNKIMSSSDTETQQNEKKNEN